MSGDRTNKEFRIKRASRIDLGLAISGATLEPGETRTLRDLAAYCDCTYEGIRRIEEKALEKVRARLLEMGYTKLHQIMHPRKDKE